MKKNTLMAILLCMALLLTACGKAGDGTQQGRENTQEGAEMVGKDDAQGGAKPGDTQDNDAQGGSDVNGGQAGANGEGNGQQGGPGANDANGQGGDVQGNGQQDGPDVNGDHANGNPDGQQGPTGLNADGTLALQPATEGSVNTEGLIHVAFPDWKGYTDDTLAMNGMYSFTGYHGQGRLYVKTSGELESFTMFVNETEVDTKGTAAGGFYTVDFSSCAVNGTNTVQVTNIAPATAKEAVSLYITYPEVLKGTPEEEGINPKTLELIADIIETDIANGFTSAQLAIIRNGRLVYENAWGLTNSYAPDGTRLTEAGTGNAGNSATPAPDGTNGNPDAGTIPTTPVTTDTLYDLASVTKMFTANYAIQKLVTDGKLDLDAKITEFLGEGFVTETIEMPAEARPDPTAPAPALDTIKRWKSELTIRDILRHQGGFPADPKYCAPKLYRENMAQEDFPENPLFAGNGADEATKRATVEMICRTPLEYEPGTKTVYSDADYMILGLVVEKITGEGLDVWLEKTFYGPLGLGHICFNPLKHGFSANDCAATELNGNTRDGLLDFKGYRTYTLQGEVHDEKAWYSMGGVSGHAGLFSNATDLAKLATVMLSGGYGEHGFFSRNVIDVFTAPKSEAAANWGLGWYRQGAGQRAWLFGTQAGDGTFGHQGWTGTMVMIDPERQLVIAYLTNKKNSPVTDAKANANKFDGDWYTASTLGFVPQILSIGMDSDADITGQLADLVDDMAAEARKLVPEGASFAGDHPAARNLRSKEQVREKYKN